MLRFLNNIRNAMSRMLKEILSKHSINRKDNFVLTAE